MLPMDLMGTMALSGGTRDDFTPLGRVEIGLFKKPGAPASRHFHRAGADRGDEDGASAVFYSDPVRRQHAGGR